MADVTVQQLAETIRTPVDRLLKQMQEAGLQHQSAEEAVSEDQKQALLAFLQRSHGAVAEGAAPRKIVLTRTTVSTVKAGGAGKGGKIIGVSVKKTKTYVKRPEVVEEKLAAPAPVEVEVEVEAPPVVIVDVSPPVVAAPADQSPAAPAPVAPVVPVAARTFSQVEADKNRAEDMARRQAQVDESRQQEESKRVAEEEKRKAEDDTKREVEARERAERQRVADAEVAAKREEDGRTGKRVEVDKSKDKARSGDKPKDDKNKPRRKGEGGDDEFGDGKGRRRELTLAKDRAGAHRRNVRSGPTNQGFERPTEVVVREVEIPETISVGELASRMSVKASDLIKRMFGMGMMATINQAIDQDTAVLVTEEMGHKAKIVSVDAVENEFQKGLRDKGTGEGSAVRPAVVTVMGHVDHGKTSLLDFIRKTKVVASEAGGITQHIGAYHVETTKGGITFIDTPGHAAFTAMRARGARATDIVILVVAADDGVMPQTEEAIQHARAANVPIVVAVNKIDKEGADPERARNELAAKNVIPDDWGGDTQFINVSALTGAGMDNLLEAVQIQAELLELRAVADSPGQGVVVESRLDRGRGPVATVLVQNGTMRRGDIVVAGQHFGRVRAMLSDTGETVESAGPSMPVEILGLSGTPGAGDELAVVADERAAREITEFRARKSVEQRMAGQQVSKLENMFANLKDGERPTLNILLKTDVRGSLEAIMHAITEMKNAEVVAQVIGSGVGGIAESDANLALASKALIFGFNVRADGAAKKIIEREGIDLRYYSVIYELLDDIKQMLSGMLAPEIRQEILGVAEVRQVFRSPRFGQVAGCMVTEGTLYRNRRIRVLRSNVVIFEGELESLRRFKDDTAEVRAGFECGIGVRNYNDVKEGDKIEVYEVREVARSL